MPRSACVRSAIGLLVMCCCTYWPTTGQAAEAQFERVAPVLLRQCIECHSGSAPSGGLDLTSAEGLLKGGDSGPALVAGQPDQSLLWERVAAGEMPPAKQGKSRALPESEQTLLREWITHGATWPAERRLDLFEVTTSSRAGRDWWSLQPVQRPAIPAGAQHPIDAFIQAPLSARNWQLAPPADRATLIRRVYNDLLGLAPTQAQVTAFVADEAPEAYERLLDELLASPQYGERWGRHWLDIVRYAETCGYERDQVKPNIWKYRDWVIDAFNTDLPYDRFLQAQLAGDELPDRTEADVIATGFLRLGTWNDEPNDAAEYQYDRLEDLVGATTSAFLGLTVKCARCHDHKFDAIRQTDYYRIGAAFWPGYIQPGPGELGGPDTKTLGFDVHGWTDRTAVPTPIRLLHKGDHRRPGEEVVAAALSTIPALDVPFAAPTEGARTSQRRLQLARWMTDPRHPLTTRVWVNRLWQFHFGQGLVRSPDNFGFTGEKPTHPELLDWLASELVTHGWQIKPLHRLMMTSQTYRQSVVHPQQSEYAQTDAGNHLWWHAERRRLEAEALRDQLLQAGGQLTLEPRGGPSFSPVISAAALEGLSTKSNAWTASPPDQQGRRSVYIFSKRGLLAPQLTAFDFPDTTLPCGMRDSTTVAPQALTLLNNDFVHQQSRALAARVQQQAGTEVAPRITAAWQLALRRPPTELERTAATQHLRRQAEYFAARQTRQTAALADPQAPLPTTEKLVLHLRADRGLSLDEQGRVQTWRDGSPAEHHATQPVATARPRQVLDALHGQPALHFSGVGQFLHLAGQVLDSQTFTIFAVATDQGAAGHREIFSNWDGAAGNSGTALFLGLTNEATVRLSDDFATAGTIQNRQQPFLLTASSGAASAHVFQNGKALQQRNALSPRNLTTPYVIGQQGNINGEFWTGDLAELIVFNRELSEPERGLIQQQLQARYKLDPAAPEFDAEFLALASLCHVLLNTNEFIYVE